MKNIMFKKIVAVLLCICTLTTMCVGLTYTANAEASAAGDEIITVLRLIEDVELGKRIMASKLQELKIKRSDAPEGVIENTLEEYESILYYAAVDMFAGDYLVESKCSSKRPDKNDLPEFTDQDTDKYIIVKPVSGDNAEYLQKIIDENPNRTIYITDGTYKVSKSIVIPTAPEKRVSLRLSQYAIITVQDKNAWTKGDAILHYGKGETVDAADIDAVGARCYYSGGTIDCQKVANAIQIDGAGNIVFSHIALKNVDVGIIINTDNVDIDSITGTGNVTKTSGYIDVNGSYNTMTNLRMCHGNYGIKLTKGANIMRNLHPLIGSMSDDPGTIAFWDLSEGNFYDYCYGDQHATTFKLKDGNTSVINGCYGYWWSKNNGKHWGIHADGRFNSVVYGTRIDMCHAGEVDNAFVVVEQDGGNGKIVDCYHSTGSDDHKADFNKYVVNN